jgi:hypothetical protein
MVPVRCSRIRLVAIAVAVVGLACAAAIAAVALPTGHRRSAGSPLRAGGFTTEYPAGWTLRIGEPMQGMTTYSIGSTSTPLNSLNLPAPGEIGVSINESSISAAWPLDPGAATDNPLALLSHIIGIPRTAGAPEVVTPLHAVTLAGTAAAAITYSYTYNNVGNVQSDIVARHGSEIVMIEMDTEPALAAQGAAALANTVAHWRWRQAQPTARSVSPAARAPVHRSAASVAGHYEVVGNILSVRGIAAERAGDELLRHWWINRSCIGSRCRLVLTRDVAAASGIAPISADLTPTRGGWTAHFEETQGCAGPDSRVKTTEFSTWKIWATPDGLEATEHGHSPEMGGCAPSDIDIHWYANKQPAPAPQSPSTEA